MAEGAWSDVDSYFTQAVVHGDAVLADALKSTADAGMPHIEVSAPQGKLLMLLARIRGARTVLEIGTLGGYSTIWLARGIPADGRIVTLEFSPEHAAVARKNIEHAGMTEKVSILVGPALDTLPALEEAGLADDAGAFDLVFMDADKANNRNYLDWALKLTRPGSVIIIDNVVRGGDVVEAESDDPDIRGTRAALEFLGHDPRLEATALQTVGSKGWDGFALAVVK